MFSNMDNYYCKRVVGGPSIELISLKFKVKPMKYHSKIQDNLFALKYNVVVLLDNGRSGLAY